MVSLFSKLIKSHQAQAQGTISITQPAEMRVTDIGTVISGAIGAAFIIAGIIIFAFLVFGGLLYITSSGDKSQAERGSQAVTGAMVGFAIIAAAYAIILLIEYLFGYTIVGVTTLPTFY
jgi:hypothetical protein